MIAYHIKLIKVICSHSILITLVHTHFNPLCWVDVYIFYIYCTGDELGKSLVAYAENESLNHTTKTSLKEFVESFSGVQDFRDVQVC